MKKIEPEKNCWPIFSERDFISGDHIRISLRYCGRKSIEMREGIVIDSKTVGTDIFGNLEYRLKIFVWQKGKIFKKEASQIFDSSYIADYSYTNIVFASRYANVHQNSY